MLSASNRWVLNRTVFRTVAATVFLLGASWLALVPEFYAQRSDPAKLPGLPADLAQVSPGAAGMLSVQVSELLASPVGKELRKRIEKDLPELDREIEKGVGVKLEDIERCTVVMTNFGAEQPLFVVAVNRRYDLARLLAAALPGAREEKVKERSLHVAGGRAVCPVDNRTFVLGGVKEVREWAAQAKGDRKGPLADALHRAARSHLAVVGINVEMIAATAGEQLPPQAEPFKPLLKGRSAVFTLDWQAGQVKGSGRLAFKSEADAKAGAEAAKSLVGLGRDLVIQETTRPGRPAGEPKELAFLRVAEAALAATSIKAAGTAVELESAIQTEPAMLASVALDTLQGLRYASARAVSQNNLKQMAISMHNYAAVHGTMPPHAVYSKDGKPLLSWRVLILPYVEQDALFKEFKLDEPWDSAHNKKLLEKMPRLYMPGKARAADFKTHYQVLHGEGAGFEGMLGARFPAAFTDGTSNTIMIVEAANPVEWTKPEDLTYDANKPLPKFGGMFPGGFNAAIFDGSVRFISDKISEQTLRSAITRNGGEILGADWE